MNKQEILNVIKTIGNNKNLTNEDLKEIKKHMEIEISLINSYIKE